VTIVAQCYTRQREEHTMTLPAAPLLGKNTIQQQTQLGQLYYQD